MNIKGIDPINKYFHERFIEVFNEKEKFTISVTSTFLFHSNHREFIKKDGYYYNYQEYKKGEQEDPFISSKETFYLKDGIGMKFFLQYDKGKPYYCSVSEINFKKNEIREIEFYKHMVDPSPDLTFDNLKDDKRIAFITITNIYEDNGKLKHTWENIDYIHNEKTKSVSYYSGYPDSKINQYWNLYMCFFGDEIR
ncbi:MAG: hypothetical protein V4548_12300 [Bacteroidota bacterium]